MRCEIYKSICVPAEKRAALFDLLSEPWAIGIQYVAAAALLWYLHSLAKVHAACFLAACNNPCGFCFHFQKIAANPDTELFIDSLAKQMKLARARKKTFFSNYKVKSPAYAVIKVN